TFFRDVLHHVDLEIPLGDHLLQARVLRLELPQPTNIGDIELPVALAPAVDRLLADPMTLRDLWHRLRIGLAQDPDHLVLGETALLHGSSRLQEPSSRIREARPDAAIAPAATPSPPNRGERYARGVGAAWPGVAAGHGLHPVPSLPGG